MTRRNGAVSLAVIALLLLSSVPPLALHAASSSTFTIAYSPSTAVFHYPEDVTLLRNVTVTNTGNSYLEMMVLPTYYGTDASAGAGSVYPQGAGLVLTAGQSQVVSVSMNLGKMASAWTPGETYSYNISLEIGPIRVAPGCLQPNFCIDASRSQTAFLKNAVEVICKCDTVSPNATISGRVYSRATAIPVAGAVISVQGSTLVYPPVTSNADGYYNISVAAFRSGVSGAWSPIDLHVTVPNSTFYSSDAVVTPIPNETLTQTFLLDRVTQHAYYKVLSKYEVDGGLNMGRGAFSGNGSYLAAVTYNPGLEIPGWVAQYSSLYFFSSNGTMLWKYPIYTPTTAVDVSDDAKYVAAASGTVNSSATQLAEVFNTSGKLLWTLNATSVPGSLGNLSLYWTPDQWSALKFSHQDGFLAAGTRDGFLYLMNLGTRQMVWEKFLGGTISAIRFSTDDSVVYVSSGNGYLYAFSTAKSGTMFWQTPTFAGASSLSFSGKYVVVSAATGNRIELVDLSGRVAWAAPVGAAYDIVKTSPDQQFVAFFGDSPSPYSGMLKINGSLELMLGPAITGAVSHDSKYVLWAGKTPGSSLVVSFVLYDTKGHALMNLTDQANINLQCGGGPSWVGSHETRIVLVLCDYVYVLAGYVTTAYTGSVSYNGTAQQVQVVSNSTITDIAYDPTAGSVTFASSLTSNALFNVTIPTSLMQGEFGVFADGVPVQAALTTTSNSTTLSFVCGSNCASIDIMGPAQGSNSTTTTTTTTITTMSNTTSTTSSQTISTSTSSTTTATGAPGSGFRPTSVILIEILGITLVVLSILLVKVLRPSKRQGNGVP